MFGRVAVAHADIPRAPAHGNCVAIRKACETERQGGHAIGEIKGPFCFAGFQHRRVHACAGVEMDGLGVRHLLHIQRQHPRHQPAGARHGKAGALLYEPRGQPDVIGVVMGDNDTAHGLACKRPCEQRFPDRPPAFGGKAGINHRPAVAIVQRIDIHVIQLHRQRQAHPKHAVSDRDRSTLCRWVGVWVANAA